MNKMLACGLVAPIMVNGCIEGITEDVKSENRCEKIAKKGGADKIKKIIPRSILLRKPDRFCVKMSKDGTKISYLARNGNRVKLVVALLEDMKTINEFEVTESVGMFSYKWAHTNNHILMYQDNGGDENDNLVCINIETGHKQFLTKFQKVKTCIAGMSEKTPDTILVATNERNVQFFDLYTLNIITGEKKIVFENNENWADFITDLDYKVRFVSRVLPDGSTEYLEKSGDNYKLFLKVPYCDSKNTQLTHLSKDGKTLYGVISVGRDKSAIVAYDLEKGSSNIIYESELADASFGNCSPKTFAPRFAIVNYIKPENTAIVAEVESDLKFLKSEIKTDPFSVMSINTKDDIWLVSRSPVCKSVQYYKYLRQQKKLVPLFASKPELDKYELQKVEPVIIKSRDGLDLVCYLTKSIDFDSCKQRKLVLLVHGGPWCRDEFTDHPWAQLLANRGYSVLQVNYRGSSGFGKRFMNAIDRNLEKMNYDLIDSVNWAIRNKIAEKDKIAIMGGSFGGYATLAGLTFFPNVFCCGVDFCGPSNWVTTIKSNPPYWAQFAPLEHKTYGNPDNCEDLKYLKKISPLNYADNICKPLMVVQGVNDPRVTKLESDQIVAKLKEKGRSVAYIVYENEGHSLMMENNRKSSIAFAEKFLADTLGGFYEPLCEAEEKGSTFTIVEGKELVR